MYLKRVFKHIKNEAAYDEAGNHLKDPETGDLLPETVPDRDADGELIFSHLEIKREPGKIKHIGQKTLDDGMKWGYITISKGKITFHCKGRDIVYQVKRNPGWYCCFTNKKLDSQKQARQYIAENFHGKESPCSNNPAGYRQDNFFYCELMEAK